MILAERAARVEAEAVAARAQAMSSSTDALIAHLKLEIEKLRRGDSNSAGARAWKGARTVSDRGDVMAHDQIHERSRSPQNR